MKNKKDDKYCCPCSSFGCCKKPKIYTPPHDCIEDICEGCFIRECRNCHKSCACDL